MFSLLLILLTVRECTVRTCYTRSGVFWSRFTEFGSGSRLCRILFGVWMKADVLILRTALTPPKNSANQNISLFFLHSDICTILAWLDPGSEPNWIRIQYGFGWETLLRRQDHLILWTCEFSYLSCNVQDLEFFVRIRVLGYGTNYELVDPDSVRIQSRILGLHDCSIVSSGILSHKFVWYVRYFIMFCCCVYKGTVWLGLQEEKPDGTMKENLGVQIPESSKCSHGKGDPEPVHCSITFSSVKKIFYLYWTCTYRYRSFCFL